MRDLAVIGFDGLHLGTLVEPPLTMVALDMRGLGALAVEEAARLLTGSGPLRTDELRWGRSCGCGSRRRGDLAAAEIAPPTCAGRHERIRGRSSLLERRR
ncbi:substrate-binding domain-containing protein [Streptomyces sp. NBC_00631]|uniref:substrate-binding domain-containing protein n=1 Tax=Streptomyces sp. NBC_00631 TaxID=2975793 RepID=UPI00386D5B5F